MSGGGAERAAVEHFECPVCFEALCSSVNGGPGALMGQNGRRVCPHYFHSACVAGLASKTCPMCRAPFQTVAPLPPVTVDPPGWFRFVDVDGSGALDYQEIIQGLLASLPLDWRRIETEMDGLWPRWSNKQSKVTYQDFSKPDGALSYILSHFRRAATAAAPEPPDIRTHRTEWFEYWDSGYGGGDGNGTLDKGEICRALIKTLHLKTAAQRSNIIDTLDSIWCLFDSDGNGSVDEAEFVQDDGLADTLIAELNRMPPESLTGSTAQPRGSGGEGVPDEDWTCLFCTIVNTTTDTSCSMCGSAKA